MKKQSVIEQNEGMSVMQTLEQGFLLQGGRYRIEKVLGQGGFGITYLAEECASGKNVAIKEFFMKTFCERDEKTSRVALGTKGNHEFVERFRVKFVKEAHSLMRLRHTNIVKVCDIFEENGTAYYVMDLKSATTPFNILLACTCPLLLN